MWGLWRNHDVFEAAPTSRSTRRSNGTGRCRTAQFLKGTPIPAVVPLPTLPMAPAAGAHQDSARSKALGRQPGVGAGRQLPAVRYRHRGRRGGLCRQGAMSMPAAIRDFPFYIPGIAGQRAPHPPLGYALDKSPQPPGQTAYLDGGLARHITLAGEVFNDHFNAWDFSKDLDSVCGDSTARGRHCRSSGWRCRCTAPAHATASRRKAGRQIRAEWRSQRAGRAVCQSVLGLERQRAGASIWPIRRRPATIPAGRPRLQGGRHPDGCRVQQGRLALSAIALRDTVAGRDADTRRQARAGAAVHPRQLRRDHRILADQLGAGTITSWTISRCARRPMSSVSTSIS